MSAFTAWLQQLDWGWVITTVITVAAALLCITFHETCHGYVACKLGDPTAKRAGRLSLNPLRHVDIVGLIVMAVFKFGWAKAVPVDPRYFKNPKRGMAITALAGPVSNLLLAFLAIWLDYGVLALHFCVRWQWLPYLAVFFRYTALLSVGLAVFNLLPIPPLDGSKVLASVLSDELYFKLMRFERLGMIVLIAVLYTGILDKPLSFVREWVLGVLDFLPYHFFNSILNFFF